MPPKLLTLPLTASPGVAVRALSPLLTEPLTALLGPPPPHALPPTAPHTNQALPPQHVTRSAGFPPGASSPGVSSAPRPSPGATTPPAPQPRGREATLLLRVTLTAPFCPPRGSSPFIHHDLISRHLSSTPAGCSPRTGPGPALLLRHPPPPRPRGLRPPRSPRSEEEDAYLVGPRVLQRQRQGLRTEHAGPRGKAVGGARAARAPRTTLPPLHRPPGPAPQPEGPGSSRQPKAAPRALWGGGTSPFHRWDN